MKDIINNKMQINANSPRTSFEGCLTNFKVAVRTDNALMYIRTKSMAGIYFFRPASSFDIRTSDRQTSFVPLFIYMSQKHDFLLFMGRAI